MIAGGGLALIAGVAWFGALAYRKAGVPVLSWSPRQWRPLWRAGDVLQPRGVRLLWMGYVCLAAASILILWWPRR